MSSSLSGSRVSSPAATQGSYYYLDVEEIYHVQEIVHEKLRITNRHSV